MTSINNSANKSENARKYKFALSIHASFVSKFVNDSELVKTYKTITSEEIYGNDDRQEDGDPCSIINGLVPVIDEDGSRAQFSYANNYKIRKR
jgi:hypothetical protein